MSERTVVKLRHLLSLTEMYRQIYNSIVDDRQQEDFWHLMDEEDIGDLQDILGEDFELTDVVNLQLQLTETLCALGAE